MRETAFRSASVVIGRGPESDFVIVDPTVSRRHARVRTDESGAVSIEDIGSRNGLRVGSKRIETEAVPAEGTLRCRLGAAEVEVAIGFLDVTLELELPEATAHRPLSVVKALSLWVAGVAAWIALMTMDSRFWSPWKENRLTTLSNEALGWAMVLPVLAFVLVGLLRVAGRTARMADTLRAITLVSWGFVLARVLSITTAYCLSIQAHDVTTLLIGNGILAIGIAYLASIARHGPRRRFFVAWTAAIAVLIAGAEGARHLAARQAGKPRLDSAVAVPLAGVTGPASNLDRFLIGLRADFATADRKAREERRRLESAHP